MPRHLTEIFKAFGDSAGRDELRPLIVGLSLMAMAVGVQLMLPYNTFTNTGTYRVLARLSEWWTGLGVFCLGAAKLYFNLTRRRGVVWRIRVSFILNVLLTLVWAFMVSVATVNNSHGFGPPLFLGLFIGCFWCAVRRYAELSVFVESHRGPERPDKWAP